MNVIAGGNLGRAKLQQQKADLDRMLRDTAVRLAIDWARSSGPEHSTRVPPAEFMDTVKLIYEFVKGETACVDREPDSA